ncbi:hypothetical protein BV898_02243 [Hypsibius exemplaris]|uniref:Uncharacterized protein n=1 Tax=Hypsibius exemplaris TaxID=2072580 RepID=A0A1W0X924_HYPEX|nr:hypothetical protein BV898_02243 [Hypsibius exemplaris]
MESTANTFRKQSTTTPNNITPPPGVMTPPPPADHLLEVRKAIMKDASMTKDLEEQIDNVTLAEQIARRPSVVDPPATAATTSGTGPSKRTLSISAMETIRPNNRIIEPIPTIPVRAVVARHSRSPTRRPGPGVVNTGPPRMAPDTNGGTGNSGTRLPSNRYQSLLAANIRGSLTSSSSDEEAGGTDGMTALARKPDQAIDPVSFSASGAAVTSFSTQTPEDMNSSDSDQHTGDEGADDDGAEDQQPIREPSSTDSTGDSSSETEEWDSEADTHTSVSDEDDDGATEGKRKPVAQYYQVSDVPKAPLQNRGMPPKPMPWLQRPAFASMQFPTNHLESAGHPRRVGPASGMPSSQSFPQDFFRMVSNPFFTTSLHDAYRQACAFKEWYEVNFPDQVGGGGPHEEVAPHTPAAHQLARKTSSSSVSFSSQQRRTSDGSKTVSPKTHAQV